MHPARGFEPRLQLIAISRIRRSGGCDSLGRVKFLVPSEVVFDFLNVRVVVSERRVNLSEREMPVLRGDLLGTQPDLYHPATRITVTPVPAILGRLPRMAESRSMRVAISTVSTMARLWRLPAGLVSQAMTPPIDI